MFLSATKSPSFRRSLILRKLSFTPYFKNRPIPFSPANPKSKIPLSKPLGRSAATQPFAMDEGQGGQHLRAVPALVNLQEPGIVGFEANQELAARLAPALEADGEQRHAKGPLFARGKIEAIAVQDDASLTDRANRLAMLRHDKPGHRQPAHPFDSKPLPLIRLVNDEIGQVEETVGIPLAAPLLAHEPPERILVSDFIDRAAPLVGALNSINNWIALLSHQAARIGLFELRVSLVRGQRFDGGRQDAIQDLIVRVAKRPSFTYLDAVSRPVVKYDFIERAATEMGLMVVHPVDHSLVKSVRCVDRDGVILANASQPPLLVSSQQLEKAGDVVLEFLSREAVPRPMKNADGYSDAGQDPLLVKDVAFRCRLAESLDE
jgi:hypothetical protein